MVENLLEVMNENMETSFYSTKMSDGGISTCRGRSGNIEKWKLNRNLVGQTERDW